MCTLTGKFRYHRGEECASQLFIFESLSLKNTLVEQVLLFFHYVWPYLNEREIDRIHALFHLKL
jgi:hypothetical protein